MKMHIVIVCLWHHALWQVDTKVSKEHSAFFFRREARSSQLLAPSYYTTKRHNLVSHNKIVLFGVRTTLHGCFITEISTIQFLINILLSGQKFLVIFWLSPVKFRHEVWNQEIKQVFFWTCVFIVLSTSCWYLIGHQVGNRTDKIICMVVQSRIWNLYLEYIRKLLAKCLPRTQKNELSKNRAVMVLTKGAFLDFCVVFNVRISKTKVLRNNRILTWMWKIQADPGGHAVWGERLRSLACWDCGFESVCS
jgi:small basic protein